MPFPVAVLHTVLPDEAVEAVNLAVAAAEVKVVVSRPRRSNKSGRPVPGSSACGRYRRPRHIHAASALPKKATPWRMTGEVQTSAAAAVSHSRLSGIRNPRHRPCRSHSQRAPCCRKEKEWSGWGPRPEIARSGGLFRHQWRADFPPSRSRTELRSAAPAQNGRSLPCERASAHGRAPWRPECPGLRFAHCHRAARASRSQLDGSEVWGGPGIESVSRGGFVHDRCA